MDRALCLDRRGFGGGARARHDVPRRAVPAYSRPDGGRVQRDDRRDRARLRDPDATSSRARHGVRSPRVPDDFTLALARYARAIALDDVPAAALTHLKSLILDHLGCALGGSRTP